MSAGCATVLSDQVGASSFFKPETDCLVFPSGNSSHLADILQDLIENADKAERIGLNGRNAASSFTWIAIAKRYVDLFEFFEPT